MTTKIRSRIYHELRETARNPGRVRQFTNRDAVRGLVYTLRGGSAPAMDAPPWTDKGRFIGRRYSSYGEYVTHQQAKLTSLDLSDYDVRYRRLLADRLRAAGAVEPRARVICLAARIGTEVKAFHDLGCFAVGIDLNPGDGTRYVLHGDFHDVQFPSGSVDVAFTNSFDHVLEPSRLLAEIRRLLATDGVFVLEISRGRDEGYQPREFESFFWRRAEDVLRLIEQDGFVRVSSSPFDEPWPGLHVTFRAAGS